MNYEDAKRVVQKIAEEIISVQPMDPTIMKDLYYAGKSEEDLKAEGYKPVSRLGLLWIKEDDK